MEGWSAIMIRTDQGQKVVASAIDSGDLVADRITGDNMLSYNRHLLINTNHPRHSWMALYQLLFFRRLKYIRPILLKLLHKDIVGVRTTFRALFNKKYYY